MNWLDMLTYTFMSSILGTYSWLIWDIAHWLPNDMVGDKNER